MIINKKEGRKYKKKENGKEILVAWRFLPDGLVDNILAPARILLLIWVYHYYFESIWL